MEDSPTRRLSGGERATVALIIAEGAALAWLGFGWSARFIELYGALRPTLPMLTQWVLRPAWPIGQLVVLAVALGFALRAPSHRRGFVLGGVAALALLLLMVSVIGLYLPIKPIR